MTISFNTTVNPDVHKVVVRIENQSFGFSFLASAINFVEEIYASDSYDKLINTVSLAMSDDRSADFGIYDIDTYMDIFEDDAETEDGN